MKILRLVALGLLLFSQSGFAALLEFNFVRNEAVDYESFTVDATTGKYYQRAERTGGELMEFANVGAFEAGVPSRTISLDGGYYGMYVAARGGLLYGKSQMDNSDSSRFNLGTGAIELTQSFPNLGGDTFAWGGFTEMNFYSDAANLFLLAKTPDAGGQTWQLAKLDSDMNIVESKTFQIPEIGFAVMIDGTLYMGQHTSDIEGQNHTAGFSSEFDFDSGAFTSAPHAFSGLGDFQLLDDLVYDSASDTLYAHNVGGVHGGINQTEQDPAYFKVTGVSTALSGEVVHRVPESLNGMAALGLLSAGMLFISRLARSAKS
jgi:hypothetical protein